MTLAAMLTVCAACLTLPGQPAESTLVLHGGRYVDVRAGVLRPNGAIVVRGGRIVAIHEPRAGWRPPAGARVVELDGRTVLPGLIDAHVHLTLAGDPDSNARATLHAGFTTVLDLGSSDGAGIKLRDAIAAGRVEGPRMIVAGSWIGDQRRRVRVRRRDGARLRRSPEREPARIWRTEPTRSRSASPAGRPTRCRFPIPSSSSQPCWRR